jgi:hypothetical protein
MKTGLRLLAMAITCAALFAIAWFFFVREHKPQFPEPPKPKTTQELLVGIWILVEGPDGVQTGEGEVSQEFTADGRRIVRVRFPELPQLPPEETRKELVGTYTLDGVTVKCSRPALANEPARTWEFQIESVTEDELRTVAGTGTQQQREIWRKRRQ